MRSPSAATRTITITPTRGWRALNWNELWAYRDLAGVLAARDIKVRYKQTVLGASWAILQPLAQMAIFSILFGRLAKMPSEGHPYPIFVYAGLLPWTFFSNAITTSANSMTASANMVAKVYFPRIIIPISSIGTCLVDLAVASAVLLLLMFYYGVPLAPTLLLAPVLLLGLVAAALGVGTGLAALNVSYRDFRYVVPFVMQIWMYATPVVYSDRLLPSQWRTLAALNPMTGIINAFRAAFLGAPIELSRLWPSFAGCLLLSALGIAYFQRVERRFADMI